MTKSLEDYRNDLVVIVTGYTEDMKSKKKNRITIHSSAAEYLTFVAASGDNPDSIEMRYQDENICITQKKMAELYDVGVNTISEHISKIFDDGEHTQKATVRNSRIVQTEGNC